MQIYILLQGTRYVMQKIVQKKLIILLQVNFKRPTIIMHTNAYIHQHKRTFECNCVCRCTPINVIYTINKGKLQFMQSK